MWWDCRRRLHETLRLKNVLKRKYQESPKIEGNTIARNWRLKLREIESQICILNSWSTLLELLILTLKSNCLCHRWILSRKEAIIDGSRVMMLSILEGNHTKAEHKIVLTPHLLFGVTLLSYIIDVSLFSLVAQMLMFPLMLSLIGIDDVKLLCWDLMSQRDQIPCQRREGILTSIEGYLVYI